MFGMRKQRREARFSDAIGLTSKESFVCSDGDGLNWSRFHWETSEISKTLTVFMAKVCLTFCLLCIYYSSSCHAASAHCVCIGGPAGRTGALLPSRLGTLKTISSMNFTPHHGAGFFISTGRRESRNFWKNSAKLPQISSKNLAPLNHNSFKT